MFHLIFFETNKKSLVNLLVKIRQIKKFKISKEKSKKIKISKKNLKKDFTGFCVKKF
jgi:hypothetical protein